VSIIPGIDTAAPERTLTSSGWDPRPNVREVAASKVRIASSTSSQIASIVAAGSARKRAPTSAVMQNAGGTGRPLRRIMSMPCPLWPRTSGGDVASPSSRITGGMDMTMFRLDRAAC